NRSTRLLVVFLRLEETHLVKNIRWIDKRRRSKAVALALLIEAPHQAGDAFVKSRIDSKAIVDAIGAGEESRQLVFKFVDRERRVGAVVSLRAFLTDAPASPHLTGAIFWKNKEHEQVFGLTCDEHRHRALLFEAGQVVQIGVLPVLVLDVSIADCCRCGWKDRGASRYSPHEFFTSLFCLIVHRRDARISKYIRV